MESGARRSRRVVAHTPAPDQAHADKGRTVMAITYLTLACVLSASCAYAQVLTGSGLDIRSEYGFLHFSGNELTVGSTIDDPPKVRLASPSGALGAVTFSRLRADGVQEEIVMLLAKEAEDAPGSLGGQFEVWVRRKFADGDQAMRLAGILTVGYSRSGEPEALWAPSLGVFTQRPYMAPLGSR